MSCYYTSWEQCRTTMSGIGGLCVASPYYHGQATPVPGIQGRSYAIAGTPRPFAQRAATRGLLLLKRLMPASSVTDH